ncbi:NAD-dependent epimerase/dehydratase family protein [Novipirellula caenicola]|uniref:NAD-dependent epimerase/dehydratase domain-containing protein n=1 Tax=Novipirellula caenicola TaxID=1536901 RepID=A0ABP9W3C8_9BACT
MNSIGFPKGTNVFVTGGSGFIGGRLVECLVRDYEANVTALVNRPYAGALRMCRFPVNTVFEPMTDQKAMQKAMSGCSIVFHLAYAKSGNAKEDYKVTVEGTQTLATAALKCGVDRFVNVSTAAVYGNRANGIIDETEPRIRWGWNYSDMKLDAENVVLDFHKSRGLPGTVLQVAGVYGPWGPVFTIAPLRQLQAGRVGLPNEGKGVSNATYVDDVVQALLRAAVMESAVGEIFMIKGPGRITRLEFYEHYQRMIGENDRIVLLKGTNLKSAFRSKKRAATRQLAPSAVRSLKSNPEFRAALTASGLVVPLKWACNLVRRKNAATASSLTASTAAKTNEELPLHLPPAFYGKYLAAETEYSIEKANRLLGYDPQFDIHAGMAATEQWARWARIIDCQVGES